MDVDTSKDCKICNLNESKYCCPRCNLLYCSLTCYKSELHLQCSETFYKECISEELISMDDDPATKTKMMQILKRMHDTGDDSNIMAPNLEHSDDEYIDSDDDASVPDLAARLINIDLDDCDKVWNILTDDERKEFESIIENDVSNIIPIWQPWWLHSEEKKLVTEMCAPKPIKPIDCPSISKKLQNLKISWKTTPALCVKYNLINVLSAYVYMTRLFNGDHISSCNESGHCLIILSTNLKNGCNFENAEFAIASVIQESLNNPSFACDIKSKEIIKDDLKCLMRGPNDSDKIFYILSALSDIHNLLNLLRKSEKKDETESTSQNKEFSKKFPTHLHNERLPNDKLKVLMKKIEYFLCYVNDFYKEELSDCSKII